MLFLQICGIIVACVVLLFIIVFFALPVSAAWPYQSRDWDTLKMTQEEWNKVRDQVLWEKSTFWTKYKCLLNSQLWLLRHGHYCEFVYQYIKCKCNE